MADTILCYNENQICEKCNKKPVQITHIGDLSDNKPINLCNECFMELAKTKGKNE